MGIKIFDNGNMMFSEKDIDILDSFNSEQSDLFTRAVCATWEFLEARAIMNAIKFTSMPVHIIIDHVKFNGPATIIFWKDGTKTVVKCTEDDEPNCETGIAMATLKKILGSDYASYKKKVKKIVDEQTKKDLDALSKEIAESIKKDRVNKVVELTKKDLDALSKKIAKSIEKGRVNKYEK